MQLKRQDIVDACGDSAFARGLDYFKKSRVLFLQADKANVDHELKLQAKTKGSSHHVYEQNIVLLLDQGFVDIEGYCSCPMHYNCKHIAAACLSYQKNQSQLTSKPQRESSPQEKNQLNPEITEWLTLLNEVEVHGSNTTETTTDKIDFPVYVLTQKQSQWNDQCSNIQVDIRLTHPRKNGNGLVKGKLASPDQLGSSYHHYGCDIKEIDRDIARCLRTLQPNFRSYNSESVLKGRPGAIALNLILETGRCFWNDTQGLPLHKGANRLADVNWVSEESGDLSLRVSTSNNAVLLPTIPPMYIDDRSREAGVLETRSWSPQQLTMLLKAPLIPAEAAPHLNNALLESFPNLPLPPPVPSEIRENTGKKITPCLTLSSTEISGQQTHCLLLDYDYDGDSILPIPIEDLTRLSVKDKRIHVHRDQAKETEALQQLVDMGFILQPVQARGRQPHTLIPSGEKTAREGIQIWANFLETKLVALEEENWKVTHTNDFKLQFDTADWEAPIAEELTGDENANGWFSLRFDLVVNDERLPLGPLLSPILSSNIDTLPDILTLPVTDHRYVRLPKSRILPFVDTLTELFSRIPKSQSEHKLTLSRHDTLIVDKLADRLRGGSHLRKLAERLRNFSGINAIPLPDKFNAELRPYQQAGLNWLQFLREYRFNGILADDMGLGKTVQTLVHLLVEKQQGRLTRPTLIIAPTSLMGNWRREIARFTPDLTVTVLHGNDRHKKFEHMTDHDIILSTYPLLSRDSDRLVDTLYHSVILDEAQVIKNPKTKMSKLVRQLKAEHRLCLSGTPLENHLGELWSLFDFLMPGFLGSQDQFSRFFRTPIEKHGDIERRKNLSQRVQPFMLRRAKAEVATELPQKTEILLNVVLQPDQAELYESIRISMDKRVRDAISAQGLARSHITILDALLKLRQVCCDPRLLAFKHAVGNQRSAKLDMLMELLPKQLKEGRRVLLFSQFTSMLELIEKALNEKNIGYTKLTGQTRQRDDAIRRFQEGYVDLFLISLKAGGTGLNLTEADTVIIYDPWWNPAVENQAIDRAHRIGQDKPVFIYKLVVENSVEEKMIAMQKHKQQLADGIYSSDFAGTSLIDADSIDNLFAPLSE
ncbi:MAG: helicase SNF2 [Gammaproteobacteria bacterium]|nr:helicase SNF2 [Gammaproteobacteria bacterium]